jgi:hypothetical protein
MKMYIFAIALCLCGMAAHADSVTIDFQSLAADAGSVITTEFAAGPYLVAVNDSLIIDDGGTIGVLPQATDSYDVNFQPTPYPSMILMDSITMTFAAATSSNIVWDGYENVNNLFWNWNGTAPDSITNSYPGYETGTIFTETTGDNGAQLTSITIVYTVQGGGGAVPEPSSLAMALGAIVATGIAVASRFQLTGRP